MDILYNTTTTFPHTHTRKGNKFTMRPSKGKPMPDFLLIQLVLEKLNELEGKKPTLVLIK